MYDLTAVWSYDGGTTIGASATSEHPAEDLPGVIERLLTSEPSEIKIRRQSMKHTTRGMET